MAYTGRTRERQTKPSVRRAENIARFLIGAGGVGTIVAVSLIFFFLLWVVLPLFMVWQHCSLQWTVLPGSWRLLFSFFSEKLHGLMGE